MPSNDQTAAPPWTILRTLRWTDDYFRKHRIENPRSDAEILLSRTLGCERIDLYIRHDQPLHTEELTRFKALIRRRVLREPVAYILGEKEFWSLTFRVTRDVLIPRPETEGLVEAALKLYPDQGDLRVLELGTGSGIISVALAHERTGWRFLATDISPKAIEIARMNARRHLDKDPIAFMVGNWFDAIDDAVSFDLILSNPPYIISDVIPTLEPDIYGYEPVAALDGGADGLAGIALIIHTGCRYLKPGGSLIVEIGYDQGASVAALGQASGGYDQVAVEKDHSGHDRLVRLRKTTCAAFNAE
jgi:release factor glutamine methyltransferase